MSMVAETRRAGAMGSRQLAGRRSRPQRPSLQALHGPLNPSHLHEDVCRGRLRCLLIQDHQLRWDGAGRAGRGRQRGKRAVLALACVLVPAAACGRRRRAAGGARARPSACHRPPAAALRAACTWTVPPHPKMQQQWEHVLVKISTLLTLFLSKHPKPTAKTTRLVALQSETARWRPVPLPAAGTRAVPPETANTQNKPQRPPGCTPGRRTGSARCWRPPRPPGPAGCSRRRRSRAAPAQGRGARVETEVRGALGRGPHVHGCPAHAQHLPGGKQT